MKLMIFIPSLGWGGMGRVASDVSCTLPESVHQTIVLIEDQIAHPYRGRLLILEKDSLKSRPVKGLRWFLSALKFRRILKEVKPDVVLLFHHDTRIINLLSRFLLPTIRYATVLGAQGIASQYGKYSAAARTRFHRFLVYLIHKHADKVIACTEGVKTDLVDAFRVAPEKIEVIYNSVDAQQKQQSASEAVEHPWFSEEIPIITSSGRLVLEKNHSDLVKAFVLVRRQRSCRLVLLGDGKLRDSIAGLASELGVSDDVYFAGYQKNPSKFVARSTLFAFPSIFEAQGLVLVEAMAVGCPIVSYDCPVGPRELLATGTSRSTPLDGVEHAEFGLLVPVGNVEALAKAILRLLDDAQLRNRYSQAGRERAAHFNLKDMSKKYFEVLNSVTNGTY
jgi:glycosyltransferase involved in cell wall biosynthesis